MNQIYSSLALQIKGLRLSIIASTVHLLRWSWVHVDDLGEAYVKVAKAGSVVDNQVFNIAAQGMLALQVRLPNCVLQITHHFWN